ncbi:flagellin N-terminal helical domain-containing protein [Desulfothermus sp.]
MALTINTNISSLIAQNSLRLASDALAKNQLRLSTGLRINSAADDAAGLSISKRMTAQIRGLNQAIRNAYDGISMMQTAEGNMDEMMNILQRMRELAVQASNALTDSDRDDLNQEYQQKMAELDRIVDTAEFNGLKLLDGTLGTATFQVGANTTAANKIQVSLSQSLHTKDIGVTNEYGGKLKLKNGASGNVAIADGSVAINGQKLNVTPYVTRALNQNMRNPGANLGTYVIEKGHSQSSAYAIAQAINNSSLGVTAHAKTEYTAANTAISVKKTNKVTATATGTYTVVAKAYGYYTLRINNFTVFSNYKISATKTLKTHLANGSAATVTATVKIGASTIAAAINKMSKTLGVTAQVTDNGKLKLNNLDGGNIKITERAGTKVGTGTAGVGKHTTGNFHLKTYHNAFDGAAGFFINANLNNGANLIGTAGFTGGANDAFTTNGYKLTSANVTVIRGTVTITGPSAFNFSDYWAPNVKAGGTTSAEASTAGNINFNKVTTSAGVAVTKGKVDFTRLTNRVVYTTGNVNMTTQGGKRTDGYQYKFTAANQQMFLKTTNILTATNAQKAIDRIDKAIADLNKFRAKLGATQNRFESTINNLNNYVQKLVDANSRIVDADVAKEAAELTMNNIKRQAASAMLAQANQNPALALQLLGGM